MEGASEEVRAWGVGGGRPSAPPRKEPHRRHASHAQPWPARTQRSTHLLLTRGAGRDVARW